MSEAQLLDCPSCGAPLHPPEDARTMRCPYCHNTVIVPSSLRGEAEPPTPQAGVVFASTQTLDMKEIRDLLAQDQKIEAVKRVRLATGLGLKEAQDVVEAVERGEDMQAVFGLLAAFTPAAQSVTVVQEDIFTSGPTAQTEAGKTRKSVRPALVALSCVVLAAIVLGIGITIFTVVSSINQNLPSLAPVISEVVPESFASAELQFGVEGIGAGQFNDPRAIAADRDGNIYVGDYSTGRLQSFDSQGVFRWLANLGEDQYIEALEVDLSGVLLVVSRGEIRRFDLASGAELEPFPNPNDLDFEDLSIAPDGRLAVIADDEDVFVYDASGNQILYIPQAVSSVSNDSELDADIDIDGLGNLYILGEFNSAIFKYSPDGRFTNRISSAGDQPGQLTAPGDLAVDGQGRVYVSDFNGVQVFEGDGRYVDHFDPGGFVFGLNFDVQDRLYTISNSPSATRYQINP